MKSNNEEMLDKVIADIRNESVDPQTVSAAADRVWARVSAASSEPSVALPATAHISGCNDFQSLIPAYLNNQLSDARKLLLVDHTHECIPCRRALKEARSRRNIPVRKPVKATRFSLQPVVLRWGIAAALVIGLGLLALPLMQRYWPFGEFEATVQAADGPVFQVDDRQTSPLSVGSKLAKGEHVRTGRDARAMVRLGDGSMIEMKDRSELYLTRNGAGTTIHLNRGNIVVEAAKQKDQLFVDTGDSLVSVTGTVFSVNNGTKGSRVSVIQGEVKLNHAGSDRVLRPGEQATTNAAIAPVPVKDEVAWSKNANRYADMLSGLASVKAELGKVPQPEERHSTHLLDLMPATTVVYAALPNLADTLAESQRIIAERLNQNPTLHEFWAKEHATKGQKMDQVIDTIRHFGEYLGDEIAVSVSMNEKGEPVSPLVLAELKGSTGLREFIQQEAAKYSAGQPGKPHIEFVENPLSANVVASDGTAKNEVLYVWIQNNLIAASPKLESLKDLANVIAAGGNSFNSTPFHDRLSQVYKNGAGLLVAANLESILAQTRQKRVSDAKAQQQENTLNQLGILSLKYFVLDQKVTYGKTHTEASLSFNDAHRGIPSWLAAPGPMGSLEYISPDANVVAGFVVRDPVALVDDLLRVLDTVSPELRRTLDRQQNEHGLNIRNDMAAPLGGEFAFAIDGPILPTPSWKLVFEVNDPQHLQETLERVVTEANKEAAKFGKTGLTWEKSDDSGRTNYTLRSSDFGVEVNFTYTNGYMIVAPSRALVDRAVQLRDAGSSLLHSSKFIAGLPPDGNANFSAVFYHNLAPLVQPFASKIASSVDNLPKGSQEAVKAMAADMPPTLAYAYAQGDSITFAANTDGGPFGLSPATLLGMPNALEMQSIIQRGIRNRN